jgi:8-oxo-dGTP diphosphatase
MAIATTTDGDFLGAKCALFIGARLVVLRRDDRPGLLWPGALDLPGGGRDPGEMRPETTVLREISEEVGLRLGAEILTHARRYTKPEGHVWFFAAHLAAGREVEIVFGNEGQGWQLMAPETFLAAPDAVPVLQDRLRHYLGG